MEEFVVEPSEWLYDFLQQPYSSWTDPELRSESQQEQAMQGLINPTEGFGYFFPGLWKAIIEF